MAANLDQVPGTVTGTYPGHLSRAQRAHSLLWDLGAAADILGWTRDAFASRVHLRDSLPATIPRDG